MAHHRHQLETFHNHQDRVEKKRSFRPSYKRVVRTYRRPFEREIVTDYRTPIRRRQWSEPDRTPISKVDTNSCLEGSVLGGLIGAGLGAVLSRGEGRWVGVPLGGAAGALVGCQVDGG